MPGGCPLCSGVVHEIVREAAPAQPIPATAELAVELDGAAFLADAIERGDVEVVRDLLRELDRDACLGSLSEFVKLAFAVVQPGVELEWGPHIQAICNHVQWQLEDRDAVVRDPRRLLKLKCRNLLINVPPRSLKTIVLTLATVWAWLRWPSLRIMYLSANPRVASTSARMARDLIRSPWFTSTFTPRWGTQEIDGATGDPITAEEWEARNPIEPEVWEIRSDQDALSDLGNTAGGARISRGLASMVTGEGCQWLCVDDAHDTRDGADKVAKAVEDYDSAVHNRLNDPRTSIRTCIMQRVRPNDIAARWIENGDLVHLRLPMEFESVDGGKVECKCGTCVGPNAFGFEDWRTVEGEVLHPRFTPEFLAGERKRLASRYVGQHQQRPLEAGGQIFKVGWWSWWSLTDSVPKARPTGARTGPSHVLGRRRDGSLDLDFLDISVDCTGGSTRKTASNLGIGISAGKGERRFIKDLTEGPATWLQTMDRLVAAVRLAGRWAGKQPKFTILIEAKALGQAAIEQLEAHLLAGDLRYPDGTPIRARVEPYEPTGKGDKDSRIEIMEPDIAAGVVHLEDGEHVDSEFRDELEGFPKATKKDRCDWLAQALDHRRAGEAEWVRLFKRKRAEAVARIAAIAEAQRIASAPASV